MKLKLEIVLTPTGEAQAKGEELRDEVEQQVRDVEVDGWEVTACEIAEGKKVEDRSDCALILVEELRKVCFTEPDEKWPNNHEHTNREMADYWLHEIAKLLGKKASKALAEETKAKVVA